MSQPVEGAQDPFERMMAERLAACAALAGELTAREVVIFKMAYEGGRNDARAHGQPTASAAAEQRPGQGAAGQAQATAEASLYGEDSIAQHVMGHPASMVLSWTQGKGGKEDISTPHGTTLFEMAHAKEHAIPLGLPTKVLQAAVRGTPATGRGLFAAPAGSARREALGFSPFPDKYHPLIDLPEGTDPAEPLVVVEYMAEGNVGASKDTVFMQLVWPLGLATRLAVEIPNDSGRAADVPQGFAAAELKRLKAEAGEKPNVEQEAAIQAANIMVKRLQVMERDNHANRGGEHVLTVLSSVEGLGPTQNRDKNGIAAATFPRQPKGGIPAPKA